MKKLLYTLFIIPLIALGQVPQGINYQAVAYDSDGFELSNKEVGVRISIVEGSAFGTPQLVEEHDVVTTEQGLFSLIIGQGALLGGEVESLLDIPWGSNTYFLKIELDTENNGSYMDFGTQQFMSVPYALYAESSGTPGPQGEQGIQGEPADPVNYDALVNELILDSAFIADFSRGSGCDWRFPEGLDGEFVTFNPLVNPYSVPAQKRLIILQSSGPTSGNFMTDGNFTNYDGQGFLIVDENQTISAPNQDYSNFMNGLLIDKSEEVNYLTLIWPDNITGSFNVPTGKKFIILSCFSTGNLIINNENSSIGNVSNPILLSETQTLGISQGSGTISGYLVDEDYFENCGGGNNTLSSSIDYNALAEALVQDSVFLSNLSGGNSMGNDLLFPEGINGEGISIDVSQSNPYFVPDGKRLYVMHWAGASPVLSGCSDYLNLLSPNPLILNAGQSISNEESNITSRLNGLLVPENDKLHGLSTDVSQSTPYVVPAGKRLYILSWTYNSPVINGMSDYVNLMNGCPLIMNSGESVYPEDNNAISRMNGYLVDEDYFEAPQAYVSDALQSTDEMFAAMQEQINTLDSLTALFEYKFELMNRPLQESLDLGVPISELLSSGFQRQHLYGLFYNGGYIFHIDSSGTGGLISGFEVAGNYYGYQCYSFSNEFSLSNGGYLPSKDEFTLLYTNLSQGSFNGSVITLQQTNYWTSSGVEAFNVTTGLYSYYNDNDDQFKVYLIRDF